MDLLKRCALLALCGFCFSSFAAAKGFSLRVDRASNNTISLSARQSFNRVHSSSSPMSISKADLAAIIREKPSELVVSLPSGLSLPASISVKAFSIFTSDAKTVLMTEHGPQDMDFIDHWASYSGSVEGDPHSLVVVTFSRFGMEAVINLNSKRYVIRAVEMGTAAETAQTYALLNDNISPSDQLRCGIDDSKNNTTRSEAIRSYPRSGNFSSAQTLIDSYLSQKSNVGERITAGGASAAAISTDTIEVRIALDGDQSLYLAKKNSFDSVTVLMLNAFSEASAVYLRDLSVSLKIAFNRVWSTPPPFASSDIFSALKSFQTYWIGNSGGLERTTTHLFSIKYPGSPGVGGYAYLNSLCDPRYGYGVTAVDTTNNGYILTFAHELGHNFGSYHTHSCLWPSGPIDHCSDIEGGCSSGPNVDTIGTIMSYCSTREMKLHPQCIALMRRVVETSWCALSTSTAAVAQNDSIFLAALYTNTAGSSWINKKNWSSAPVKGRFGVAVRSGRVISIDLAANNLVGALPSGLTNLTALRRLNLSGRNFHHDLAVAGRAQEDIINNQNTITGSIPAAIDQLSALEYLDLSNNNLSGSIPASITNLTQLRWLNLSENFNLVAAIPATINNLSNLELLDLYRTNGNTQTIPATVTSLPQLRVLILEGSYFTGTLPAQIGSLSKLWLLDLSNNTFTGSIPASITSIATLEQLRLEYNQLSGTIPSDIGNLKNLTTLALNDNQFTGTIPASFSALTKVGSLNLSRNKFSGTIPASIGDMSLLGLYLSDNAFSGTIPVALGKLSSVIEIDLSRNAFTGTIPDTLRNLGSTAPGDFGGLIMFNVGNNQLTGAVPSWLSQRTVLSQLDLGGNNFTPIGPFPQWIVNLPSPVRLYLSNLGMSGTIPAGLMTKTSLDALDLSNNQLTGPIPTALGNLTSLRVLRLSNNQLTGPIPMQISNISFLTDFRVGNNQLTDTIPGFFVNYPSLTYLHLQNNKFSGKAPKNLVASGSIKEFLLSNNDLESLPGIPNSSVIHTDTTSRVEVENNRVTFTDLLPYLTGNLKGLKYAPQKPLASAQTLSVSASSKVTLTVDVPGNGNVYKWYKNDSLIAGASLSAYEIISLTAGDTASYSARVTNPAAALLTLVRSPYIVKLNGSTLPGDITLVGPRSGVQAVSSVILQWNADSKATQYRLEVDTAGTFTNLLYQADSIAAVSKALPLLTKAGTYYWRVRGKNNNGTGNWSSVWSFTAPGGTFGVTRNESTIPKEYRLDQNFPNPFNPSTTITFALPKDGHVQMKIFNVIGQLVTTLVNEELSAGNYSVRFDAGKLSSGMYLYRIESGKFSATKRLMLVK